MITPLEHLAKHANVSQCNSERFRSTVFTELQPGLAAWTDILAQYSDRSYRDRSELTLVFQSDGSKRTNCPAVDNITAVIKKDEER
jgi:hypothetical protein